MQLLGEPEYVKQVKKAHKKGYTYQPELYKDRFDGQAGGVKRQKLPRPKSPVFSPSSN
jgi:hypothetical protein